MTASLSSAPHSVDPLVASSHAELTLSSLLFDTLYRRAPDGRIVPHLAESAELVKDGRTLRITLRAGARFHDGQLLGAKDVVASLRRAQRQPLTRWAFAAVKSIAQAGSSVVIVYQRKVSDPLTLLATPQLAITPGGRKPNPRKIVGSGPFAVRRLALADRVIELVSFADHFAGRPYLDEVRLSWSLRPGDEARAYEAGKADVSLRGAVAFAGHAPKYPTKELESAATTLVYLGFGNAHPAVLTDPRLRHGASLAIVRSKFRNVGTGETILPTTLPESPAVLAGGNGAAIEQLGQARDLLNAMRGLHPELSSDHPLTLIIDNTRLEDSEVAELVVAALTRAGLSVSYTALSPEDFDRRVKTQDCDLYIGEWVAPVGDPLYSYAMAFSLGRDPWLAAKLAAGDAGTRALASAFAQRLPVVPLYFKTTRVHYRSSLREFAFGALGVVDFANLFFWADGKTSP